MTKKVRCNIKRGGRGRAGTLRENTGPSHPPVPFSLPTGNFLGLSALSFVTYRARIHLCQIFHGRPVCLFLDQCFPAHCLFHPAFTSFPDRIKSRIPQRTT